MKFLFNSNLWLVLMISGCSVFETEPEMSALITPEPFGYFTAEINGELWEGDYPDGGFVYIEEDTLLQVFSDRIDSLRFPYMDEMTFSYFYTESMDGSQQSVIRTPTIHKRASGGFYSEADGDAVIAYYLPIEDSLNAFTVQIEQDEKGAYVATGTFEMKVVVESYYDTPHNNQYRQQPDTLRITNGAYKVKLREKGN